MKIDFLLRELEGMDLQAAITKLQDYSRFFMSANNPDPIGKRNEVDYDWFCEEQDQESTLEYLNDRAYSEELYAESEAENEKECQIDALWYYHDNGILEGDHTLEIIEICRQLSEEAVDIDAAEAFVYSGNVLPYKNHSAFTKWVLRFREAKYAAMANEELPF